MVIGKRMLETLELMEKETLTAQNRPPWSALCRLVERQLVSVINLSKSPTNWRESARERERRWGNKLGSNLVINDRGREVLRAWRAQKGA
jgi:hypothetical protein